MGQVKCPTYRGVSKLACSGFLLRRSPDAGSPLGSLSGGISSDGNGVLAIAGMVCDTGRWCCPSFVLMLDLRLPGALYAEPRCETPADQAEMAGVGAAVL